ncbi:MAG: ribonuclease III [Firmicutes bacterium]|nr:ribonuclease III [Bacillota bacterium]
MSDALQTQLSYDFKRTALLRQAVTHSSFVHEQGLAADESNERLEFLGDAVLELCISDLLYHRYPGLTEGQLTQRRANLVCEPTLAAIARHLKLGDYLLLGQGEAREKGREKDSILSDALESVFGAIYLDGGIDAVRNIVFTIFGPIAEKALKQEKDSKSTLQELLQKNSRETAAYEIVDETGPPHQREFTAIVSHKGKILGRGKGKSKKEAEQSAASVALKKLQGNSTGK